MIAILGMLFWSFSIIIAGKTCPKVNCVDFTCIMFFVSAVFCLVAALIMEPEQWVYPMPSIANNWIWILTTGFTEAFACTLCNVGQKYADDSRASLIMSLESVLAAFVCYVFLGEALTPIELLGCAIMVVSTMLTMFETNNNAEALEGSDDHNEEHGVSSCVLLEEGTFSKSYRMLPSFIVELVPTQ